MAFIPAANTVRAALNFTIQSVSGKAYVWHFHKTTGTVTPEDLTTLADAITPVVDELLPPVMSPTMTFNGMTLRDMSTYAGAYLEYNYGFPIVGTNAGAAAPASISCVVKHATGFSGRSYMGRTFMTGLTETQINGNFIESTTTAAYTTFFDALRTAVQDDTEFEFVVASFFGDGEPRLEAITTPVTASFARNLRVKTKKSRLPKTS